MDATTAFQALKICVGTVVDAQPHAETRKPALKLTIDFGADVGTRHSSAQVTEHYGVDDLVGRQILGAVNLPPKRIAGFVSEVLVLGVPDDAGRVVLIGPDRRVPNGGRLY